MAVVNRVESAAEEADGLGCHAGYFIMLRVKGSNLQPQSSAPSRASSSHASPPRRPLIMRSARAARAVIRAKRSCGARRTALSSDGLGFPQERAFESPGLAQAFQTSRAALLSDHNTSVGSTPSPFRPNNMRSVRETSPESAASPS